MEFEKTFMDFLLEHQERHNRSYHFLILMNSLLNAAKRIQFYYQIGALRENLGKSGTSNVQGEEVMKMDEIADTLERHVKSIDNALQRVKRKIECQMRRYQEC